MVTGWPSVAEAITSKRDLAKVQAQFNAWAEETGLPYVHLSRICAMSVGENYEPGKLAGLGNRLGPHYEALRDALAQLRLAYVAVLERTEE